MEIFAVIISKNWSDARLLAHYEKILETNMKIKNAHHLEKQSNIKNKTLILIIYFHYL